MITFDGVYHDIEITKHGKYIKIQLDTKLIEYIVGTLISIDTEPITNYKGIIVASFATNIKIGEIVAVKFKNDILHRLKEGEQL